MVEGDLLKIPAHITKTRKAQKIPLGPELKAIIERRKLARRIERDGVASISEFIFHRGDGLPILEFRKSWRTACRKANCAAIPHDLRRVVARRLIKAGVPMPIAMRVTGHKTPSMFIRYGIVDEADQLAAQTQQAQHRRKVLAMS